VSFVCCKKIGINLAQTRKLENRGHNVRMPMNTSNTYYLRLLFDDVLGKWNYVAVPKNKHLAIAEIQKI
jgi:hypothetical protein